MSDKLGDRIDALLRAEVQEPAPLARCSLCDGPVYDAEISCAPQEPARSQPQTAPTREELIAVIRSKARCFSPADDVEPHLTNAPEIADAILARYQAGSEKK